MVHTTYCIHPQSSSGFISSQFIIGLDSGLCQKANLNTSRQDHITPVLASLYWLPVSLRVEFQINFKALHGSAPGYIADFLLLYEPEHILRQDSAGCS